MMLQIFNHIFHFKFSGLKYPYNFSISKMYISSVQNFGSPWHNPIIFDPGSKILFDIQINFTLFQFIFYLLNHLLLKRCIIVPSFENISSLIFFILYLFQAMCSQFSLFRDNSIRYFRWQCILVNMIIHWMCWIMTHIHLIIAVFISTM